jgi:hypothetical protein
VGCVAAQIEPSELVWEVELYDGRCAAQIVALNGEARLEGQWVLIVAP